MNHRPIWYVMYAWSASLGVCAWLALTIRGAKVPFYPVLVTARRHADNIEADRDPWGDS